MFSPEINQLVRQEQHKDRLQQIEQQQLIRTLRSEQPGDSRQQQAAQWLGSQLVKWGERLQQSAPPASSQTHLTIRMK